MPQLSAEHKQRMAEGRKRYHDEQRAKKQAQIERWEQKALVAQGGEPDKPNKKIAIPPPKPSHEYDFQNMDLEEVREWITATRKRWDEAIEVLRVKEAQWSAAHNSVECACGCGTMIDLSRSGFASSESYHDKKTGVMKNRYWATQRCVQAYRLANSPEYKAQLARELEDKAAAHIIKSEVLEG